MKAETEGSVREKEGNDGTAQSMNVHVYLDIIAYLKQLILTDYEVA